MLKHKKITKAGAITLPKDIRFEAGMLPGIAVDVVTTGDSVVIKKHVPACNICGNAEDIRSHTGYDICGVCLQEFNKH